MLKNKLSETALTLLIADHRQAPLRALLAKEVLAERELAQGANTHVQEKLVPLRMKALLATEE